MKTVTRRSSKVEKVAESAILKDSEFVVVAKSVKPDSKKRVVLPKHADGITYHIYSNKLGQLILDPQVTIPASEAWIWENPDILESLKRGLADVAAGRVYVLDPKEFKD